MIPLNTTPDPMKSLTAPDQPPRPEGLSPQLAPRLTLRPARSSDGVTLGRLIELCYREYGEQLCPQGADADLGDLESHYPPPHSMLCLLTDEEGEARGSLGAHVDDAGVCKLRRLYLDPALRGGGWAGLLMDWTLGWARGRGAGEAIAWSDVRFHHGHRFFLKRGFEARPDRRTLDDGVTPYTERLFVLRLR